MSVREVGVGGILLEDVQGGCDGGAGDWSRTKGVEMVEFSEEMIMMTIMLQTVIPSLFHGTTFLQKGPRFLG